MAFDLKEETARLTQETHVLMQQQAETIKTLESENAQIKAKVNSLEDTVAAISKLYNEKVRYAEEEGTHAKLRAIQGQISEAVRLFIERMRNAIDVAQAWGDEHNVVGRGEMLAIIERALPRR